MVDDFDCLLACIRAMDSVWLEIVNDPDPGRRTKARDMTPELFDKLF